MSRGARTRALVGKARKKFSKRKKSGCQKCKQSTTDCPKAGKLGNLSKHYESGKRGSDAISSGKNDAGGRSYGAYQIASRTGKMHEFIEYSRKHNPKVYQALSAAGGASAAIEGTKTFQDAWLGLAKDESFLDYQHEFIKATNYDPVERDLQSRHGLDLSQRSAALRDVVWSVAVQHGQASARTFKRKGKLVDGPLEGALKGKDVTNMSDRELIDAIYDYRANKYWPKEKESRYKKERECALKALDDEQPPFQIPANITIEGDEEFKKKTQRDLKKISSTESGRKLLESIGRSGKKLRIHSDNGEGNWAWTDPEPNSVLDPGYLRADGSAGPAANAEVGYSPDRTGLGDQEPYTGVSWAHPPNRPADVGLFHELVHADDIMYGRLDYRDGVNVGPMAGTPIDNSELRAAGLPPYDGANAPPYSENSYRRESGLPARTFY
jgi:hypothetical protein